MRKKYTIVASLAAFVAAVPARAQSSPSTTGTNALPEAVLEGAWLSPQVRVTLRDGRVLIDRQRTMYVATRTHYSRLGTTGESQSFYGNAGRYEVARDSIIFHMIVANPTKLAGGVEHYHVRAKGDSLWLTGTTDDFYELRDGRLIPSTPGFRAIEILLVRLPK